VAAAQPGPSTRAAEHDAFSITACQVEGDEGADEVREARNRDHQDQVELALRGKGASKRNYDLARDRKTGALADHRDENRDEAPRGDKTVEPLGHKKDYLGPEGPAVAWLGLGGVRPPRRAQLARDAAGRLPHPCRKALCQTAGKEAFGGVDHSDRTHRASAVIEDGRRDA
jgi:hypothetical protein